MTLAEFIHNNMDDILEDWRRYAATVAGTGGMSDQELQDHAREMLGTIADQVEHGPGAGERKPNERTAVTGEEEPGKSHASARLDHGFSLYQIMAEFRALRATVLQRWRQSQGDLDGSAYDQFANFNDAIDRVMMDSVSAYAEQMDESRQVFLGVLGHDLRNPLNAMMMCATLLRQDAQTPKQTRCAATILNSGQRIDQMLGDLLDLARTRLGGDIPLDRQPLNLCRSCEEVVAEQQAANPSAGISLNCAPNITGEWDEVRLNQLLSNLTSNAVKHGDADSDVAIDVYDQGDYVQIEVHNYGNPIPHSASSAIFNPLTALRKTESRYVTDSGIGLGLYICRLVTEAHDGRIWVTSSEEEGTRFCVCLPKQAPPKRAKEQA